MHYSRKFLDTYVTVTIDRPLGSKHPTWPDMCYEVNYGYIPKTMAPDGEELDAYVLGVDKLITLIDGFCIALIHRFDDDDDKLIVVPKNMTFSDKEIRDLTRFQEKFFSSEIIRK